MALNRRELLCALPPALLAIASCAQSTQVGPKSGGQYEELFRVAHPGTKGKILVLMPSTTQTKEVWTGLNDELGREYDLVAVRIDSKNDDTLIDEAIRRHKPLGLVLMNNPTVAAYGEYQRKHPAAKFPPGVIVMASFLDTQRRLVQQVTGVYYEIPLITVVTNLRKLIARPIDRVGVVRRGKFSEFVQQQAKLAEREGIQLVDEYVSDSPNSSELKRALRLVRQRSDALWILNDDKLLTPRLITEAWLPGLSERPWIPTLVGAASLVSPGQGFGTFAVLPDHTALGVQTAALVFDLADESWSIEPDARLQLPVSTTTTIDLVQVKERFELREGALAHVDRILK